MIDEQRVAKINAIQAIVVALISSVLTLVSTAGVKFIDNSSEIRKLTKQSQEAQAEKDSVIAKLSDEVKDLKRRASEIPAIVLLRARSRLTPAECLNRALKVLYSATGKGGGGQEVSQPDGAIMAFSRPYMARLDCGASPAIVAVAAQLSADDVFTVAQAIKSAIE